MLSFYFLKSSFLNAQIESEHLLDSNAKVFNHTFSYSCQIVSNQSDLMNEIYTTGWKSHKICLGILKEDMDIKGKIVMIEKLDDQLIYRPIIGIAEDEQYEIGILSQPFYDNEKRGLLKVCWELKYDFIIQIRHYALNQSLELVIMPRVFERRKGISEWTFKPECKNIEDLPLKVNSRYDSISSELYDILIPKNWNSYDYR